MTKEHNKTPTILGISCSNGDCQFQNDGTCHNNSISVGDDMKCQSFLKDNALGESEADFDEEGRCKKCGSKISFADSTDTVIYCGNEIIKTHPGDIVNRNCVRCTYPKAYPEFKEYEGN
jgi:hypothetical protein